MVTATEIDPSKKRIIHALEVTNFYLADVQIRTTLLRHGRSTG
jgi:hypothetical protein